MAFYWSERSNKVRTRNSSPSQTEVHLTNKFKPAKTFDKHNVKQELYSKFTQSANLNAIILPGGYLCSNVFNAWVEWKPTGNCSHQTILENFNWTLHRMFLALGGEISERQACWDIRKLGVSKDPLFKLLCNRIRLELCTVQYRVLKDGQQYFNYRVLLNCQDFNMAFSSFPNDQSVNAAWSHFVYLANATSHFHQLELSHLHFLQF